MPPLRKIQWMTFPIGTQFLILEIDPVYGGYDERVDICTLVNARRFYFQLGVIYDERDMCPMSHYFTLVSAPSETL